MNPKVRRYKLAALAGAVFCMLFVMSGCTWFKAQAGDPKPQQPKKESGPVPLYYDFGDVLVPSELKLIEKSSFVFKTPGLSAGVLALKGRVEMSSLIDFFENNMAKDNWRQVSSFKSTRTIMLFQKENRWCVINITDGDYNTMVEIWVAPTTEGTGAGLLK